MTTKVVSLVIYAYSSFVSSWGAGPEIIKKFESQCACKVMLVDGGDGGSMINRIKLEGTKTKVDIVLGVDKSFAWRLKKDLGWSGQTTAFDKAPLAFIYNSEYVTQPPESLEDLLLPQWKNQVAIEDPRLSITGLGFLLWVIKERGEEKAWKYFEKLAPQLRVISPSWELAYGMFKKNQSKLVLSYWTSPAYHIQEEGTEKFKAARFKGGHYEQVEVVAINPKTTHRKLAESFIDFILERNSQEIFMNKNFMYPVSKNTPLTSAFKKLGQVEVLPSIEQEELEKKIEVWLKKWREIFSK